MDKYFLHRIQKEAGVYSDGIEVHDTLDSAKLAYLGREKLAYGKTGITFMYLKVTDCSGAAVPGYRMAWKAESEKENLYFVHHIRKNGETFEKDIDPPLESFDIAKADFAAQMEYGFNNPKHAGVSFVNCCITDIFSGGLDLREDTWEKAVEPEPEVEPAPAE